MSSSGYALRDGHKVVCKCPVCSVLHTVSFKTKPIIMPRIYCKDHFNYRYDDGEGHGYMTKARMGRSAKS